MNRSEILSRRLETFIADRQKLLKQFKNGQLSEEVLNTTLQQWFETIREERETSYYAELPSRLQASARAFLGKTHVSLLPPSSSSMRA